MSLAAREGQYEADRKERFFAARKIEEDAANKEAHYQMLITENLKLKEALKLAHVDITDWIYSYGSNDSSEKALGIIETLI